MLIPKTCDLGVNGDVGVGLRELIDAVESGDERVLKDLSDAIDKFLK